jgi:hypothetical protein
MAEEGEERDRGKGHSDYSLCFIAVYPFWWGKPAKLSIFGNWGVDCIAFKLSVHVSSFLHHHRQPHPLSATS